MLVFAFVLFFFNILPSMAFFNTFDGTQHMAMRAAAFIMGLIGIANLIYFSITIIQWAVLHF